SSENQAPGRCGEVAAPIRIRPLIQRSELDDRQRATPQRQGWRGPAPQHPVAERAERPRREEYARPGLAEDQASHGQGHALPDRIDRAVGWLLQYEESFKELRERMRGIRQAEMAQSIGYQEMAEFVVQIRCGDGVMVQQREAQSDGEDRQ